MKKLALMMCAMLALGSPLAYASEVTGDLSSTGVVTSSQTTQTTGTISGTVSSGSQVGGTVGGSSGGGSTVSGTVTGGSTGSSGGGGGGSGSLAGSVVGGSTAPASGEIVEFELNGRGGGDIELEEVSNSGRLLATTLGESAQDEDTFDTGFIETAQAAENQPVDGQASAFSLFGLDTANTWWLIAAVILIGLLGAFAYRYFRKQR